MAKKHTDLNEENELANFSAEEGELETHAYVDPAELSTEEELSLQVATDDDTIEPVKDEVREILQEDSTLSEGTELAAYESAEIEEIEFVETDHVQSIIESLLFATDKPLSFSSIRSVFEGTNIKPDMIRRAIAGLQSVYADPCRGVTLEEISSGYQLRTKMDNQEFLKRLAKVRPFKLSGPALEVLAIVAYKQPIVKSEVDQIRGVESGHLMRALMDRGLISFAGKSDLPGRPMLYQTTRKFLEIFSLRNLKELPSLSEIDQLLPEGIGEDIVDEKKPVLADVTAEMSLGIGTSYSESEEELQSIAETLSVIDTTTEFFEQEKQREKERRDKERAETIREALAFGESVEAKDVRFLEKWDRDQAAKLHAQANAVSVEAEKLAEVTALIEMKEAEPTAEL